MQSERVLLCSWKGRIGQRANLRQEIHLQEAGMKLDYWDQTLVMISCSVPKASTYCPNP